MLYLFAAKSLRLSTVTGKWWLHWTVIEIPPLDNNFMVYYLITPMKHGHIVGPQTCWLVSTEIVVSWRYFFSGRTFGTTHLLRITHALEDCFWSGWPFCPFLGANILQSPDLSVTQTSWNLGVDSYLASNDILRPEPLPMWWFAILSIFSPFFHEHTLRFCILALIFASF